jgi:hypothetical protein
VTCDAVDGVETGEEITIDFAAGTVTTPRGVYTFPPLPPEVMQILEAGGLIPYVPAAWFGVSPTARRLTDCCCKWALRCLRVW